MRAALPVSVVRANKQSGRRGARVSRVWARAHPARAGSAGGARASASAKADHRLNQVARRCTAPATNETRSLPTGAARFRWLCVASTWRTQWARRGARINLGALAVGRIHFRAPEVSEWCSPGARPRARARLTSTLIGATSPTAPPQLHCAADNYNWRARAPVGPPTQVRVHHASASRARPIRSADPK